MPQLVTLKVNADLQQRVKAAAALRGVSLANFVGGVLRPAAERVLAPPPPISIGTIAVLVDAVAQRTGEDKETCMTRLLGRAAVEDFAALFCPD